MEDLITLNKDIVSFNTDLTIDIKNTEQKMLNQPQVGCQVKHELANGLYIRTVFLPAGSFVIGHEQKCEHMNVMLTGKVLIIEGNEKHVMTAPRSFIGSPGRKVGYIIEDTIWQNVYAFSGSSVEEAEDKFLRKSDEFLSKEQEHILLKSSEEELSVLDYKKLLDELETDESSVRKIVNNTEDLVEYPYDKVFRICNSYIEGKGIFVEQDVNIGFIIGAAKIGNNRTDLGRYINHSINPNSKMIKSDYDGDIYVVAIRDIKGRQGGLTGDEVTIDYRETLNLVHGIEFKRNIICQQ